MQNDSSLGGISVFDLTSESGIMQALASVRAAEIADSDKNELRDLIFLYINGGRDESVSLTLEQKLIVHNIKPVSNPALANKAPAQVLAFGSSRPAPSFPSASAASSAPVAAQVPVAAAPAAPLPQPAPAISVQPSAPSVPVQSVTSQQNVPVQPVPTTAAPVFVAQPAPQTPVVAPFAAPAPQQPAANPQPAATQSAPVSLPITPSQPAAQTPHPAPATAPSQPAPIAPAFPVTLTPPPSPNPLNAPAPVAQPAPPSAVVTDYDPDQNLRRIREIKSLVNEQVGNPVNLIDIDNTVGRDYMSALLEAMKKLNSGQSAISSMQRLEVAYQTVEKVLADHKAGKAPTTPTTPEPTVAPVPVSPVHTNQVIPKPPTVPVAQSLPVAPAGQPIINTPTFKPPVPPLPPSPTTQNLPDPPLPRTNAKLQINNLDAQPTSNQPPANQSPLQPPVAANSPVTSSWGESTDTQNLVKSPTSVPRVAPVPPVASVAPSSPALTSVRSADKQFKTPSSLPTSNAPAGTAPGDPLFVPEVDNGLNQLLVEWSIFKKSGLFGTGPKGREHPLFKKVAPLQIPLLLAGRFEGSTQEIRQSITDYMNGWRYEQGIIYEQNETFEHYLRRVIKHIINLQSGK